MKIAINTTCAVTGGAVTHLRHIVPPLLEQAGRDELVMIGSPRTRQRLKLDTSVPWVDLPDFGAGLASRLRVENVDVPRVLRSLAADVLLHPANFAIFRSPVPQVILIHNLAPYLPEVIGDESLRQRVRLSILRWLTNASLDRVDRAIFISGWGRRLVLGEGRDADPDARFPVIAFGAEHGGSPSHGKTLTRLGLEARGYVLTVSHIYRYKRLEKLLEAWAMLGDRVASWPLVIVGEPFDAEHTRALRAQAERTRSRVLFTGGLEAEALQDLMSHARLFVFTSEAENLPITLLEAMAAGCPIVTNRFCSMPEVCGDAARYVEPATSENYASALDALLGDDTAREALRGRARARAREFSWTRAAGQTLEVLRSAARRDGLDCDPPAEEFR